MTDGNRLFHGFLWFFLTFQVLGISVEALFSWTIFYESIVHGMTLFILVDEQKYTLVPIYVGILGLQYIPYELVRAVLTFLSPLGVALLYYFGNPQQHSKEIMTHIFVMPAGIALFTFLFFFPIELYGQIPRKSLAKLIIRPFIVCLVIEVISFYFLHAPLLDGEYRYNTNLGQRRWMALMASFTLQYLILIAKCFMGSQDDVEDEAEIPLLEPNVGAAADSLSTALEIESRYSEPPTIRPTIIIEHMQETSDDFEAVPLSAQKKEQVMEGSSMANVRNDEFETDFKASCGEIV